MKQLHSLRTLTIILTCAALVTARSPVGADDGPSANAAAIKANAGVTAVLTPTSDPAVAKVTITGVIQSSLGTWLDSGELEARFPATPDQPVIVNGTATWTSLDGANTLKLTVAGTAIPDPASPAFYNANYQITFTGGTGAYASARGQAELNEVVMFTSAATATTTWNLKGFVIKKP